MRQVAILVVAGLSAIAAPSAAAQLPDIPLPDVPDLPDVEVPDLPGDDEGGGGGGGGGSSGGTPSIEVPIIGGGSGGGSAGGGAGNGSGGGSESGSGGGKAGSGGGGSTGGHDRSASGSCPCPTPATGYPVNGDYDKCFEGADSFARGEVNSTLAASGSEGMDGGGPSGGILGAGALGEDSSQSPAPDAMSLSENPGAQLLAGAVLALTAVALLIGIGGGLKALHGRRRVG
jgi:hypothetical protein